MIEPLLAELRTLAALSPALVASEVRPFVAALAARARKCDECHRPHIAKSAHRRARAFCTEKCRLAFHRLRRAEKP